MRGRRRDSRYRLSTPVDGALETLHDIVIERYAEKEVIAVAKAAVPPGAVLTLEVPGTRQTPSIAVRVVDSSVVLVEGALRYRIRLAVIRPLES